jgi:hypothetical protein
MKNSVLLKDYAKVIRSKNAGPFEVTFDIIFKDKKSYNFVKNNVFITKGIISKLYNINENEIITFVYFDVANALKITLPRRKKQGSEGETDMHQAQQYIPLMYIEIADNKN